MPVAAVSLSQTPANGQLIMAPMEKKNTSTSVPVSRLPALSAFRDFRVKNKSINSSRAELTATNHNLATRLNKKKLENKKLRDKVKELTINTIKYRQFINQLQQERQKLQSTIQQISISIQSSISTVVKTTTLEQDKLKATLDNLCTDLDQNNMENVSYLANTTLLKDTQRKKVRGLHTGHLKSRTKGTKVVNMVRPMKCGYVVGHPQVNLRRLSRNNYVPQSPLNDVPEVEQEDEEDVQVSDMELDSDQTSGRVVSPVSSDSSGPVLPAPVSVSRRSRARAVPRTAQQRKKLSTVTETSQPLLEDSIRMPRSSNRRRPSATGRSKSQVPKASQPKKPSSTPQRSKSASTGGSSGKGKKTSVRNQVAETMSKEQSIQINTRCSVVLNNWLNRTQSPSLRTASPVPSGMLPVVMLDRITTRKKCSNSNEISDHEEKKGKVEEQNVEKPDENKQNENDAEQSEAESDDSEESEAEPPKNSPPKVVVIAASNVEKRGSVSPKEAPIVNVSSKQTPSGKSSNDIMSENCVTVPSVPDLNLSHVTVRKHTSSENEKSVPARRSIDFDDDMDLAYSDENGEAVAEKSCQKSSLPAMSTKTTPSDFGEDVAKSNNIKKSKPKSKKDDDPDYVPEPVKINRPMPKSAKLLWEQRLQDRKSEELLNDAQPKKKFAGSKLVSGDSAAKSNCKNKAKSKQKVPTSSKRDTDFSTDEDRPVKGKKQNKRAPAKPSLSSHHEESTTDSMDSTQSCVLSPEDREIYMNDFFERIRSEDPLEGTSTTFDKKINTKRPKKTTTRTPIKKSNRLHEKKQYVESPASFPVKQEPDESWRPERPKPLSKKRASKKK